MRRAAECNGARHRHCASMADAQLPFDNTKVPGGLCGTTRKPDLRRSSRGAMDNNIRECYPSTETGSQRLQDRFLCGEPASQALDSVGPVVHLIQLFLDKAALEQGVAWIFDPAPHLGDVDQINPVSDDVHILLPICRVACGSQPLASV
jgi:hypothetical protein